MQLFLSLERFTTRIALVAAIAFLVTASGLSIYQVLTRFVLGAPSTWSEVAARSAMIWSVFLGVAPAFAYGSMISIEVVQTALPRLAGRVLMVVSAALSLIFFAVVFWQGWAMTERVANQTVAGLQISISWAYAALPVGSLFALPAIAAALVRGLATDTPHTVTEAAE